MSMTSRLMKTAAHGSKVAKKHPRRARSHNTARYMTYKLLHITDDKKTSVKDEIWQKPKTFINLLQYRLQREPITGKYLSPSLFLHDTPIYIVKPCWQRWKTFRLVIFGSLTSFMTVIFIIFYKKHVKAATLKNTLQLQAIRGITRTRQNGISQNGTEPKEVHSV